MLDRLENRAILRKLLLKIARPDRDLIFHGNECVPESKCEICDDGNTVSDDGCSSMCRAEWCGKRAA